MNCPCKKVSDVKKKSATINNMFLSVDSLTRHAVLKAALGLCCFLVTNFLKYFFEKSWWFVLVKKCHDEFFKKIGYRKFRNNMFLSINCDAQACDIFMYLKILTVNYIV